MVLTLYGHGNPLIANFFPPLEGKFEIGLLSLHGCNFTINVCLDHNILYYNSGKNAVEIPPDIYSIGSLTNTINRLLMSLHPEKYEKLGQSDRKTLNYGLIDLTFNHISKRVEVICAFSLDDRQRPSLMKALGFEKDLAPLQKYTAQNEMKLCSKDFVRVNCNAVQGCIYNGQRSQSIYEFDCKRHMGERFVESPPTVVYFPVTDSLSLRQVGIELCNKNNEPLDLLTEYTLVRLHLKRQDAQNI